VSPQQTELHYKARIALVSEYGSSIHPWANSRCWISQSERALCFSYVIIFNLTALLRDSVAVVVRTRPRAIPLAMITTRKSTHGFPFLSHEECGAPLGGPIPEPRYEMFVINELRPSLNVQSDSTRAKLFWSLCFFTFVTMLFLHVF